MIYQIKVSLVQSDPKIWRRILVPSQILLPDLHKVIQTSMGWENAHLHQFIKDDNFYTLKLEDDWTWENMNNVDYKEIKLSELIEKEKDKIIYEYDFGDGWEHELLLEKIKPLKEEGGLPLCLDGKNNCPPEDCGGIWGYHNLLKIIKNPDHEEYEMHREWLGGDFDPEYFDKELINTRLKEKDFGVFPEFF